MQNNFSTAVNYDNATEDHAGTKEAILDSVTTNDAYLEKITPPTSKFTKDTGRGNTTESLAKNNNRMEGHVLFGFLTVVFSVAVFFVMVVYLMGSQFIRCLRSGSYDITPEKTPISRKASDTPTYINYGTS